MAAWRHPGARVAAGLCVMAALGLTATATDFSSTSLAAARARSRTSEQPRVPAVPPAGPRPADVSVPATPPVEPGGGNVPAVATPAPAGVDTNGATGQL